MNEKKAKPCKAHDLEPVFLLGLGVTPYSEAEKNLSRVCGDLKLSLSLIWKSGRKKGHRV